MYCTINQYVYTLLGTFGMNLEVNMSIGAKCENVARLCNPIVTDRNCLRDVCVR